MKQLSIGQVVKSIKGRDEGKFFLVRSFDADFCYIVDGRFHKQTHLKKKNLKHIEITSTIESVIAEKWQSGKNVFDSEIASTLKHLNKVD